MTRYIAAWGERGEIPTAIRVVDDPAEAWRWLADVRQDQENEQYPDISIDEPYSDTFYELERLANYVGVVGPAYTNYVGVVGPAYTKTIGSVVDSTDEFSSNGMEYRVDIYVDEEED